ncbi:hypothetical protein PF003_g28038 [Phytophthora fragariae]|nr:hypothetical protein PF003_g28038 [Phytophthora fragariae]
MPLGYSDDNKLDPFLIFETQPSKIADTARKNMATRHGFGQ